MSALLSFEALAEYYNGYAGIAERVERNTLQYMHIPTPLDDAIEKWIAQKYDVILTGNPGDGKTHLINTLQERTSLASAYLERDASQKETETILNIWLQKKQVGVPFLLAINHAPLRKLAVLAKAYQGLEYLTNIPDEIDNLVYYNEEPQSSLGNTIVVDLNQREIIDPAIVKELAQKLIAQIRLSPCSDCPPRRCPVEYNAQVLSNNEVLENLITLLSLVAQRGFHISMRDLIGLFAYILTGNKPCANRWKTQEIDESTSSMPTPEEYTYYNLLFTGKNPLFDAIRATFDPANYSDPTKGQELWNGVIQNDWIMPDLPVSTPATLKELRSLKRRYFFEHHHSTSELLQRMLPSMEQHFDALVRGTSDDLSKVESLISMINTLYAPIGTRQQHADYHFRLRLWNNHRYSIGSTPGYFAMRSMPADNLTLYRPKASPKLSGALNIPKDHVLLAVQNWKPGAAFLKVDWPMYQALTAAYNGTPIDVQPFHILRRLDLFLRSLGFDAGGPRHIENIEWSDHRQRALVAIRVNRNKQTYEQERRV